MDALAQVEDNLEHGDEKTRLCVVMYVLKIRGISLKEIATHCIAVLAMTIG